MYILKAEVAKRHIVDYPKGMPKILSSCAHSYQHTKAAFWQLELLVRVEGDEGTPVVVAHPDSPVAERFMQLAKAVAGKVSVHNAEEAGVQWISMV